MSDSPPLLFKRCLYCGEGLSRRDGEKANKFYARQYCDRACFLSGRSYDIMFRFQSLVDKRGEDECWPWNGELGHQGHGRMVIRRKKVMASHVALEISGNPKPFSTAWALHSCDNPPCCNPRHLRWGTSRDNTADMFERGRQHIVSGSLNGQSKLTEEMVRAIRSSEESVTALARRYGVSKAAVSMAKVGKTWRHIL